MLRALALAGAVVLVGCRDPGDSRRPAEVAAAEPVGAATLRSAEIPAPVREPEKAAESVRPAGQVRVEQVDVEGDLPVLVVRASGDQHLQMVFLPGMCVHPGVYAESFQHAAASHGDLVAMQGDVPCGGDAAMRKWSSDLDAMDRRIEAAFRASGLGEPRQAVVIGYSQGAERGERLVARWPDRYDRAVLMGSPVTPSPKKLGRARSVVLMAGTYDMATGPMQGAVAPLKRASVDAIFLELPGARHGGMGEDPEATMNAALDFVAER